MRSSMGPLRPYSDLEVIQMQPFQKFQVSWASSFSNSNSTNPFSMETIGSRNMIGPSTNLLVEAVGYEMQKGERKYRIASGNKQNLLYTPNTVQGDWGVVGGLGDQRWPRATLGCPS
jgi:hypothetical protein